MWLERFVIISVSLSRDFMTSAWHNYQPTTWDFALFLGSIGLFLTLWFLFLRFLPAVASTEVKELVHHTHHHAKENKA
jgi:molybdopterin-containing oxidoreductase family membrane subunit